MDRAGLRPTVMRLEPGRGRLAQIELADAEQLIAIIRALDHAACITAGYMDHAISANSARGRPGKYR
jgi:hypothetical protein